MVYVVAYLWVEFCSFGGVVELVDEFYFVHVGLGFFFICFFCPEVFVAKAAGLQVWQDGEDEVFEFYWPGCFYFLLFFFYAVDEFWVFVRASCAGIRICLRCVGRPCSP